MAKVIKYLKKNVSGNKIRKQIIMSLVFNKEKRLITLGFNKFRD